MSEMNREVTYPAEQAIQMMRRAAGEITELRKIIDAIGPRAEAYELIKKILGLVPGPGMAAGEDLAYTLNKEADKLQERLTKSREAKAVGSTGAAGLQGPSAGSR